MTFEKDTIGVVGHGFVGHALQEGMKHAFQVLVYDPFKYTGTDKPEFVVDNIEELTHRAEVIFVCVPTPMNSDGSASTKIVDGVISSIAEFKNRNVVVIKSTVPPGTTERLHEQFGEWEDEDTGNFGRCDLKGVVFNPEFLTEANYIEDFKNQNRIIIGSSNNDAKTIVKRVYQKAYPAVPTIKTHPTIAEMVKYTTNTFLATKVSFANEIQQTCEALDIDYDKVIEYARFDERLGDSHWAVPGPDGKFGFGGSCFPKDLNALVARMKELGVTPTVLSAAWQKNLEVRPEQDWRQLKGRAVVDE